MSGHYTLKSTMSWYEWLYVICVIVEGLLLLAFVMSIAAVLWLVSPRTARRWLQQWQADL